ncbi:LysR substrate-binding domain-containing protein [Pendulispora rubella]|uniref:LysR substrate-binding domain-containing protein n=1 Tax=Pendulispora rubella TaxID=2741070 RepID=A0ABZ2LLJ7_9BACT
MFGRGGRTFPWEFVGADGEPVLKSVHGRFTFNHGGAILHAAVEGHGLALLPNWMIADAIRSGQLVPVLPGATTRGFPLHAVWPRTPYLSPKVRVMVDALVRRFLPTPPWERTQKKPGRKEMSQRRAHA